MKDRITYKVQARMLFLLTLFHMKGITLYKVRQEGEYCFFTIKGRDRRETEETLLSHDKEFIVLKDNSTYSFKKENAGRIGLYLGIVILLVGSIFWSGLITKIDVIGNELVPADEIRAVFVQEKGLPIIKKTLNVNEARNALISIEGIANASMEIKGNVLIVRIAEELPEPDVEDIHEPRDRFSGYDAVVVGVVPIRGTPLVSVGDVVKRGEKLLSGTQTDSDGNITQTNAFGMVYGRVWVTKERVFTPTTMINERTGREKSYYVAGNSSVYPKAPFERYEKEETIVTGGNGALFSLKKITYYETKEREVEFDYEGNKEAIVRKETLELEKEIPTGAKKVRTWYNEKTLDKNYVLDIYYEIVINLIE